MCRSNTRNWKKMMNELRVLFQYKKHFAQVLIQYYLLDEIETLYHTMEKSTSKIHWMKEALDEWTTAMARGDETNKLIEKYCKEDRKRAEVNCI